MDQRHTQIREGAGLEESKLNVEFIDFLRRWSTPVLLAVAVAALGWVLYQRFESARAAKVDQAFGELDAALVVGSPETLKAVADAYEGVRGVPVMARLAAADTYLQAARTGVRPGAMPKDDGSVAPEDLLNEQDRAGMLDQAERLYTQVLSATGNNDAEGLQSIGAAFGVAAVAESRGQMDAAKQAYERVVSLAVRTGLTAQGEIAKKRIADLPSRATAPKLYTKADLPAAPTVPSSVPPAPAFVPPADVAPAGEIPPPATPAGAETPASEPQAVPPAEPQ